MLNCLVPFIMTAFLSSYLIILKKKELKDRILIGFSIAIFLFQPAIIKSLLEILKCKGLYPDPGKSFIFSYMSEECYSWKYYKWVGIMVIPAFLLYCFVYPLSFYYYIKKNQFGDKEDNFIRKNHIMKLGFIREKYQW